MAYSFFRHGPCVYWHENPETLERAHHLHSTRGLEVGQPGPIETTDVHPRRFTGHSATQAWRVDA
jgi:hypothetical protein